MIPQVERRTGVQRTWGRVHVIITRARRVLCHSPNGSASSSASSSSSGRWCGSGRSRTGTEVLAMPKGVRKRKIRSRAEIAEERLEQAQLDPVCAFHGKHLSEHECRVCCLCFKDLNDENTVILA